MLIASVLVFSGYAIGGSNTAQAQGIPAAPYLFAGDVKVAGNVAPDGLPVTAKIGEYESEPSFTGNGRYSLLTVSPDLEDSRDLENLPIHFYLDGVKANETKIYKLAGLPVIDLSFNLSFPNLPVPTPTPTPVPLLPAVYSGSIVVSGGGIVPADAVLVGKVGDYVSPPAFIQHGTYMGLFIDPNDPALRGATIEFVLNGVIAARTDTYVSGSFVREFDLAFGELPTPVPVATATAVPATVTPVTSPTSTAVPATATAIPPTATPVLPTPTVLATATAVPTIPVPTASAPTVGPTPTLTPQPAKVIAKATIPAVVSAVIVPKSGKNGGGASSTGGDCALAPGGSSGASGTENVLLLMAPLALVLGIRRKQKNNSK